MELTKNDSKMLQGLSVLAMVCLHLFDRDYTGLFTPIIFFKGIPLSFYFGQLSDFCVFGFAFLSGYAHFLQFEQPGYYKRRLKGLLSVYASYWLILILFSIVGIIIGQGDYMPGSIGKFILNALTLENSYNGAWWYLFTYAILVFISPLILKCVKHWNPFVVIGMGFVVYFVAYCIRFKISFSNWFLCNIGPFGMTFFEYLLGAVVCKYKLFTRFYSIWQKFHKVIRFVIAFILIVGILLSRTLIVPSLFVAPISGFVIMTLFHFWEKPKSIEKVFLLIGEHSTNIWLTHMFFCLCMFTNLVYIAKYPILVFGFMITITLLLSILLKFIENPIQKQISKI